MKKFILMVGKNKTLREEVEASLSEALGRFLLARAAMSDPSLEEAIMIPSQFVSLDLELKNIMSVNTPVFKLKRETSSSSGKSGFSYSFASTSGELDIALNLLQEVFDKMIELAEVEKSCQLMANEIEKTRRRVNALEYVMIPQLTETVKYIAMKLDENERGSRVRLMKVKDIVGKKGI